MTGLRERGMSEEDMRLYSADQILDTLSSMQEDRSVLAAVLVAVTDDRRARQLYRDNALAGGSALWLFAPQRPGPITSSNSSPTIIIRTPAISRRTGFHDLTNWEIGSLSCVIRPGVDRMGKTRDIRAAVEAEFTIDPRVDATNIVAMNVRGEVALHGTVPSYPQLLKAGRRPHDASPT